MKSANLEARERFTKRAETVFSNSRESWDYMPTVLLCTCNRVEIYFSAEDLANAHSQILAKLRKISHFPDEQALYSYFGRECFRHLARVTSGLDSIIVSESEIQRQVKLAYTNAALYQRLPKELHYVFQKCLSAGKEVRTQYPSAAKLIDLEHIIEHLISVRVSENTNILVIGNSEINRKILTHLADKTKHTFTLATRTPEVARERYQHERIRITDWSTIASWHEYCVVLSGTKTENHLLLESDLAAAKVVKTRLVADLSMPRAVDPALEKHPYILSHNIETLSHLVEEKREQRTETIQSQEIMIEKNVTTYISNFMSRDYICA